jgi:thiamine-monophosphate kinase
MKPGDKSNTPLGDLGKYSFIGHISKKFELQNKSTVIGIGDDTAIIDPADNYSLVSTDLLLEGIHFNLVYFPLKHLGYKAVIRAISDIYAMNGVPEQVLLGLGISSRFSVEQIDEILDGAILACKRYKVDLAGGDTTSSVTGLTISVTAVGSAEKGRITRRDGARPNDLICVTGDLGGAYLGLQVLERETKLFEGNSNIQPDLTAYNYIIQKQLKPEVPFGILDEMQKAGIGITSMIDVTDGLASDIMQICKSSDTGCRIYNKQIPIDTETIRVAEEFNIDPLVPALHGGDDFELLFTIPLDMYDKIRGNSSVSIIGHITEKGSGNFLIGADGSEVELTAQGWKKEK